MEQAKIHGENSDALVLLTDAHIGRIPAKLSGEYYKNATWPRFGTAARLGLEAEKHEVAVTHSQPWWVILATQASFGSLIDKDKALEHVLLVTASMKMFLFNTAGILSATGASIEQILTRIGVHVVAQSPEMALDPNTFDAALVHRPARCKVRIGRFGHGQQKPVIYLLQRKKPGCPCNICLRTKQSRSFIGIESRMPPWSAILPRLSPR